MTRTEYAEYERAVADFMKREGIQNLSMISEDESEPFFSWRPCQCCNTHLGGNRMKANGWNPTEKQVQEYTVCTDCLYYAEYEQLDDMTMMDMDQA